MATLPPDPCALGHQELKLLVDVSTFGDRFPVMLCSRCGKSLSFEDAVRNDERIKWAAEFDNAAEWHRADARRRQWGKGSNPAIGFELAAEQLRESCGRPAPSPQQSTSDGPFGIPVHVSEGMPADTLMLISHCRCGHAIASHGPHRCSYVSCTCTTPITKLATMVKITPPVENAGES